MNKRNHISSLALISFTALWLQFCFNASGQATAQPTPDPAEVLHIMRLQDEGWDHVKRGNPAKAIETFQHSLELGQKLMGPSDPLSGHILSALASARLQNGDFSLAVELWKQASEIFTRRYGSDSFQVATTLDGLAKAYISNSDYEPALVLLERALEVIETTRGKSSLEAEEVRENLAWCFLGRGSPARALAEYQRCLRILDFKMRSNGEDSVAVEKRVRLLVQAALACKFLGNFDEALRYAQDALSLAEKTSGLDGSSIVHCLEAVSSVHQAKQDFREAVQLQQRAIQVASKAKTSSASVMAGLHARLAGILKDGKQFERALDEAKTAVNLAETQFGADSRWLVNPLATLASVLDAKGDREDADLTRERQLTILKKQYGDTHPEIAHALRSEAFRTALIGEDSRADEFAQRSLAIYDRALGPDHKGARSCLHLLALSKLHQGAWEDAVVFSAEQLRRFRSHLANELPLLDARERMRIVEQLLPRASIGHSACNQITDFTTKRGKASVTLLAEQSARDKALLMEMDVYSTVLELESQSASRAFHEQHRMARVQLARLYETISEPIQREILRRELLENLGQMEKKLAKQNELIAQTMRDRQFALADVAFTLPTNAVLVDFVSYHRYDASTKTNGWQFPWKEERFAAYLTFPAPLPEAPVLDPMSGRPVLPIPAYNPALIVQRVDLGEAAPINAAVAELHQLFAERRIAPQRLEPVLQRLGALLYKPLARHLTNVAHLIVCPDGQLGRLPFELLPVDAKGRRLVEDKLITYVSSGREVARLAQPRAAVATTAPLVMGNPDFDFILPGSSRREEAPIKPGTQNAELGTDSLSLLTSAATSRQRFLSRSFRDFKFTPLPDSEHEARKAAAMLGTNCVLRLGASAREADLKAVSSPRVLHLATHGFFLTDQEFKRTNGLAENFLLAGSFPSGGGFPSRQSFAPPGQDWENPLIRCGIALAGANRATGITNAQAEDGILTGLEAALLNLQGTELVILSACDSGSGDVKIGEGVMSLRRAFTIAGAETVLASHWKVNDAATSTLMTEFMRRWQAGTPRGQAWREAQLSLLRSKEFSNPYFWAAFTLTGQWR